MIDYVIEEICAEDTQLVVLGTGEERYENLFRHFEWKYHVCDYLRLNATTAILYHII